MPIDKQQEGIIGLTIEELQGKVAMLEGMNASLQLLQTRLRDEIAAKIFVDSIKIVSAKSAEARAEDAFRSADAFMRVREQGKSYENAIIEDIQTMVANKPNDQDLGETVRQMYRNQE